MRCEDEFFFRGNTHEFTREEGDIELPQRVADIRETRREEG